MFKIETLKKIIALANAKRVELDNKTVDEIKICISAGNIKIGRVMNVSIMPIITCHNCTECKFLCYDVKACNQYANTVIDARMRNTVLATKYRDEYFKRIDIAMSKRRKNKYFRWHVAGDILDYDYFCRMVDIAKNHPDFVIWTYTKYYEMVNKYVAENGRDAIPTNFHIMFSEWDGMKMDNPYNFPIFTCRLKAGNKNHTADYFNSLYKCAGNCDICKLSGHGCVVGESTYCDEH